MMIVVAWWRSVIRGREVRSMRFLGNVAHYHLLDGADGTTTRAAAITTTAITTTTTITVCAHQADQGYQIIVEAAAAISHHHLARRHHRLAEADSAAVANRCQHQQLPALSTACRRR
mmetsp:Transcript_35987/g.78186  ORF Transcript_35987/g.78186 Transcript_35987/m.78186 type:complete len:117 (+) Transcript_35987:25-375(+)